MQEVEEEDEGELPFRDIHFNFGLYSQRRAIVLREAELDLELALYREG